MLKLVAGTFAALLMSATGNEPQDKKHDRTPAAPSVTLAFKQLDVNGDGKVSQEEFLESFRRLDRNQDGTLTPQELSGSTQPGPQAKHGKSKSGKGRGKH